MQLENRSLENKELGHYRLRSLIGQGRLAQVWLADHALLHQPVALKVIADNAEKVIADRFGQQAAALAGLEHPNILPIIDYGSAEGYFYLAQPYVAGGSLQQRLNRQPLERRQAFDLFEQVLRGLAFAHSQGVLHCDLKPGNILLYPGGRAVLTDFGLAAILNLNEGVEYTLTGKVLGSPRYMAPEQFLGQCEAASDLYSLGVILYQLLTGELPYTAQGGENAWELGMRHTNDPLPLPHPAVPRSLEKFLTTTLQKRPAQRYSSAEAMLAAFRQAVQKLRPEELAVSPPAIAGAKTLVNPYNQPTVVAPVNTAAAPQSIVSPKADPASQAVPIAVAQVERPVKKHAKPSKKAAPTVTATSVPVVPASYRPSLDLAVCNAPTARFEALTPEALPARAKTIARRGARLRPLLMTLLATGWLVALVLAVLLVRLMVL